MPTGVSSLAFYGHLLARYYVSYRFYYYLWDNIMRCAIV